MYLQIPCRLTSATQKRRDKRRNILTVREAVAVQVRTLAERLPDARACSVPGARHFGPNTHPDEVGTSIREFVARV